MCIFELSSFIAVLHILAPYTLKPLVIVKIEDTQFLENI